MENKSTNQNVRDYLTPGVSETYNFAATQFFFFQSSIAMKYEDVNDIDIRRIGQKAFIDKYDKYILHAVEEVTEASDVSNNSKEIDELIGELIDVIMYTGSAQMLIARNLDYLGVKSESDDFIFRHVDIMGEGLKNSINRILLGVVNKLSTQRMVFPQRKWHKPYTDLTSEELRKGLLSIHASNKVIVMEVLQLLLNLAGWGEINRRITEKQDMIIGLPLVEGGEII